LSAEDIKGECRINYLLQDRLEEEFYEHIPFKDEGQALSNKDVGLQFSKDTRQIIHSNKADPTIKKFNLKDSLNATRGFSTGIKKQSE